MEYSKENCTLVIKELTRLRGELKLRQCDVADSLGIDRVTFIRYERMAFNPEREKQIKINIAVFFRITALIDEYTQKLKETKLKGFGDVVFVERKQDTEIPKFSNYNDRIKKAFNIINSNEEFKLFGIPVKDFYYDDKVKLFTIAVKYCRISPEQLAKAILNKDYKLKLESQCKWLKNRSED